MDMRRRSMDNSNPSDQHSTTSHVEVSAAEAQLKDAYKNLDKSRRRLKTVKSLVYYHDDDALVREEMGDASYFKLREISDQITYAKQEIV